MTRLTTFLVALVVLLVAPLLGVTAQPVQAETEAEVIGHRGAARTAPENTVSGIKAGLRGGSDAVEVDVRLSADSELVLMHDATLERTTDAEERFPDRAPWHVGDFTLSELQTLDAGSWKHRRFAGERVPTLRDALDAVQGRGALLIELKDPRRDPGMEARVAQHITSDGTPNGEPDPRYEVAVQSFDYLAVARFAAIQPDIPTIVLTSRTPGAAELDMYRRYADGVSPPHAVVEPALIEAVQTRGMKITPYTVNGTKRMRRLLSWGVDGIVTDVPARLHYVRATSS